MKRGTIGVVGAGPAGLTAALALRQAGANAVIFEQAPEFQPIGAGLALHANGAQALHALGVLDTLRPHLRHPRQFVLETNGGQCLSALEPGSVPVPHAADTAITLRADLQQCLLDAATRARIPIQFGRRCRGVGPDGQVLWEDGGADQFDAVLACDGVHSPIRESLNLGGRVDTPPEAYLRGVVDVEWADSTVREIWGPEGRRFGIAPLPGNRTYWFTGMRPLDWTGLVERGLPEWIAGWRPFGPNVMRVLGVVRDWQEVSYGEAAEVKLPRWHCGSVFLLGDAAHAMTPNVGQGANSAMVDAVVLARMLAPALAHGGDLDAVGRAYERLRRPPVERAQRTARQLGRVGGWRSPLAQRVRSVVLPASEKLGWLKQSAIRVAVGFNPAEQAWLTSQPETPVEHTA